MPEANLLQREYEILRRVKPTVFPFRRQVCLRIGSGAAFTHAVTGQYLSQHGENAHRTLLESQVPQVACRTVIQRQQLSAIGAESNATDGVAVAQWTGHRLADRKSVV